MKTIIIDGVEYNLTPKVAFREGDWVVIDGEVLHVREVTEDGYLTDEGWLIPFRSEKEAHIWTIQDAKGGDVLEFCDHGRLVVGIVSFISKRTGRVDVYCLLEANNFKVGNYYALDTINPHPATKEQRDILFQKMHEAGYEWDAEKKELKKIEQKPAEIEKLAKGNEREKPISICSEEDEKMLNDIIKDLVHPWNEYIPDRIEDEIKWLKNRLKSLRPRSTWKPSEEMLEALYRAVPKNVKEMSEDEMLLDKLYQGLKYGRVLSEN